MLNIVWCLAAVGTDVKFSILNDSALIGAKESTMSGSRWARACVPSWLVLFLKMTLWWKCKELLLSGKHSR